MTLEDMIIAAATRNFEDPHDRAELSDALEDAGRVIEAEALRSDVSLVTLDKQVMPWWCSATQQGTETCRCRMAEWLRHGADIVRVNGDLRYVKISDREPMMTERGDVGWVRYKQGQVDGQLSHSLPGEIHDRLLWGTESDHHGSRWWWYSLLLTARVSLSTACLSYAREHTPTC